MKKFLTVLLTTLLYILPSLAQNPKWLKKVRGAQAAIMVYYKNGDMKETQGVFSDEFGTILTEYDDLKHATRAVVVDANGKEYPVKEVCGANAMYNVAKLRIELAKGKITYLNPASIPAAENSLVYILPNVKAGKNALCAIDTIKKTETFKDSYSYYTIGKPANERQKNSAVLNEAAEMIGLLQLAAKEGKNSYVIDGKFIADMKIRPMDAGNNDLKAIYIKKALPETEEDALTYLYLLDRKDSSSYMACIDEFIQKYPANTSGRVLKAESLIEMNNYPEADKTYEEALNTDGINKDEVYYSKAKAIYTLNLNKAYSKYNDWDMNKALEDTKNAYNSNPLPIYTQQEAHCLFAMKRFDEAHEKFVSLTKTNLRSADMFLNAAQCLIVQNKEEGVLALLDSALACYSKPYPVAAANTILIRADALTRAGKNKEAVLGLNEYEHLAGGNLNANFYYGREQLEIKCRMYPQALSDIEKAIKLQPKEPLYCAEAAALNFRIGQIDDAIEYAKKAIAIDEKFPDPYRIIGVCYNQKGNKVEARKYLQKAIDLGDTMASGIIEKMK
ncbi:MAG: tetratricopeptide repeat protein [Bacteroidaceae bacterium]|nr:tetratricopeptide repeat protein [Bacteroidaceae bacterium]